MEPIQNALSSALAHVTGRGSLTTEPSVGASANLENAASLLREALGTDVQLITGMLLVSSPACACVHAQLHTCLFMQVGEV